jgi:FMN phosphatase YigB (HAD superfamily)
MDDIVFLIDVDNTLLDNDAVITDLRAHLQQTAGPDCEQRYWQIFEQRRSELGYADYLGALQQYRVERPRDPHILETGLYLLDYPFAARLYPGALDTIGRLRARSPVVILSDGDVVFQPRKVHQSGLWDAVGGRVLIYVHKEQMLEDVAQRYPARRYVMIDDKVRILAAMKAIWRERLTTIFVRQGHYATDEVLVASYPPPDLTVPAIADVSATIGG